jgi:AmmeMemoRadiSam system protein B
MTVSKPIRKPAVAGFFYPRGADVLAGDIDRMIDSADAPTPTGRARVLVSPHAGYKYSGQVAANGFRLVRGRDFHTVVVVSPSHVEHFDYSAVFDGGGYETPLGVAATSEEATDRVASVNRRVIKSPNGHEQSHLPRQEHALEVQIPFLQRTLESFGLVAVVMGDQNWESCTALGEALKPLASDPGVLIVASTDLSHFYNGSRAERLDRTFSDTLTSMDAEALYDAVRQGRCEACGAGPVIASLLATEDLAGRSCTALSRRNSGDVTGDYSGVVGYLSAVVTTPQEE